MKVVIIMGSVSDEPHSLKITKKLDEYGIKWDDDFFSINWPIDDKKIIISKKDTNLSSWHDVKEKVNSWSWS